MALKKQYASEKDIPEAMKGLYKQAGNVWVLDLEGDGDGGDLPDEDLGRKLGEFRANNRKLAAELKAKEAEVEALRKRSAALGDRDPDEVTTALDLLGKLKGAEDEALIKAGRFDDVVARRTKAMQADYQKKLDEAAKQRDEVLAREAKIKEAASQMLLEKRVRQAIAAKKVRVLSTAESDLLARARASFRVGEDLADLAPIDAASTYNSPEEWVDKLVSDAPHLFDGGGGGGTKAGPGTVGSNGVRTVKRSEISATEYSALTNDIIAGKVKVVS